MVGPRTKVWLLISSWVLGAGCGHEEPARPEILTTVPPVDDILVGLRGLPFMTFVSASYEARLQRNPEVVVTLGLADRVMIRPDELTDVSEAFALESFRLDDGILEILEQYDRSMLSASDRLTYDVYAWVLDDQLRAREFRNHVYPVHHMFTAIHNDVRFFFTEAHPLVTVQDAENYVARLRRVEYKIDQAIEALDRSRREGIVLPSIMTDWALSTIDVIARGSATRVPFYTRLDRDLRERVREGVLTERRRQALQNEAADILDERIIPAYQRLREATAQNRSAALAEVGVGSLPNGAEYYAAQLRHHTTTELTAEEIHMTGLREVDRIESEIRSKFMELGYSPDLTLETLFGRLAEDDGWVPATEVVATYEGMIREAEAALDFAFDLRPKSDVVVIGGSAGGLYLGPSLDGTRPGAFYAQNLEAEPRFAMKSLAYHEAVPGHHLQIGIASELDLPLFRNVETFTGYVEGWALYAEGLAPELGLYDGDAAGDLGRLQAEIFRACRLVVDTGIHAMGWTFDEARSYFMTHTGFRREHAEGQIGRYIVWPGQATAYKTGMLRIGALRKRAEEELGPNFDLKAFHRTVLGDGSMPLDLLDVLVEAYIDVHR